MTSMREGAPGCWPDWGMSPSAVDMYGEGKQAQHPDADHYAKKFNLPLGYNADADKKSWAEMQTFFKDVFGK